MRLLLWAILLIAAYFWLTETERGALLLERGKELYQEFFTWLDKETSLSPSKKKAQKRSRRWD